MVGLVSALSKYSAFRLESTYEQITHQAKNKPENEQFQTIRALVRNLPTCFDDELSQKLYDALQVPIKIIKHVKAFCFVTFFDEQDCAACVKLGTFKFGSREVVPDFITDAMRQKY